MTKGDAAPTPAHLFLALWRDVAALSPSQRSTARRPAPDFREAALEVGAQANAKKAAQGLAALIDAPPDELIGRKLGVMLAIDDIFGRVHPRAPRASMAGMPIPDWLRSLRDDRISVGHYLTDATSALVPRGPLLRRARNPHACSAESLADRFSYLSVAPLELSEKGSSVTVTVGHVGMDLFDGVEPIGKPGSERILFVPVAEAEDDLDIHPVEMQGNRFAHYGPATGLEGAERFMSAIRNNGGHDMAVAPELVLTEMGSRQISTALRETTAAPRLLLLGTQHSECSENGQAFNEAVLVNSVGKELWRQRKLWPAELSVDKAEMLGLCCPNAPAPVLENNAAGRHVHIADIDGFGRVLVLICQDTQLSIANELIDHYQPDWVLVPVLDSNLSGGRWAHQRTLALSANAQSRFVAVTSMTLKWRYGHDADPVIGMAIGPAAPASSDEMERAAAFILADPEQTPAIGSTSWGAADWVQSKVGTN